MGKWADKVTKRPEILNVAYIKFRDASGNWIPVSSVLSSNPLAYASVMAQVKKAFPDRRIRTVDARGRLLDLLD